MNKTIVESVRQQTHDCPMCDGIMPDTAIEVLPWRHTTINGVPYHVRRVSMHCPHCGHRESKVERKPINNGK